MELKKLIEMARPHAPIENFEQWVKNKNIERIISSGKSNPAGFDKNKAIITIVNKSWIRFQKEYGNYYKLIAKYIYRAVEAWKDYSYKQAVEIIKNLTSIKNISKKRLEEVKNKILKELLLFDPQTHAADKAKSKYDWQKFLKKIRRREYD